jgi:tRNA threonylcarbamoyladenosine biosynthesis protein TsaE
LGVTDEVQSPTFALVHEYNTNKEAVFHLDLYRLHSTDEALRAGLGRIPECGENYCFIEWPGLFKRFFSEQKQCIFIFPQMKTEAGQ